MGVSSTFESFCSSLRMDTDTVATIRRRYHSIVGLINEAYWNSSGESLHGLYVGSYGRGTEIATSDIDILVELPHETFRQYDRYTYNGQSALLQDVKSVIQTRYSTSHLRGDGQVIVIDWTDGITFEIVPAFSQVLNGGYWYPNTHDGGSWATTNPKSESNSLKGLSLFFGNRPKHLCRMTRAWRDANNIDIHGIAIDSLVFNFFQETVSYNQYRGYGNYGDLVKDFFSFVVNCGSKPLTALGNKYVVPIPDNLAEKAEEAYEHALEAMYDVAHDYWMLAEDEWKEVFGDRFTVRLS